MPEPTKAAVEEFRERQGYVTPEERAIRWCGESHPLQGVDMIEAHRAGRCCPECRPVAAAIREAEAAMREQCARVAEEYAEGIAIADDLDGQSDTSRAAGEAARDIAEVIRALP